MRRPDIISKAIMVLLLATAACRSPSGTAEQRAFEQNCAGCHSASSLVGTRASGLGDAERKAALDKFLAGHHAPDADVRRQIIDHLAAQER